MKCTLFLFFTLGLSLSAAPWKKHVILSNEAGKNSSVNAATAADVNGDGHIDVLASFNGTVTAWAGPNFSRSQVVHRFTSTKNRPRRGGCIHGCMLDVNQDGFPDYCGSNNQVFWLQSPGKTAFDTTWTFRNIDSEIAGTHCLITGDVDRDGRLDLIANSFQTQDRTRIPHSITWLSVPTDWQIAKAWPRYVFADRDAPGGNHYMGFGDVNKDGRGDIACGAKGGPGFPGGEWFAWWEQPKNPQKPWKKHLLSDQQPGASNILPVDLNADGHVDYLASRGHGKGVLWFAGPDFKTATEIDAGFDRPHCLAQADIDGDGDPDFASCGSQLDGIVAWWENDGKANFKRHDLDQGQSSYDIRLVDLDGDKDLDILIAGHFSRNVVWYEQP